MLYQLDFDLAVVVAVLDEVSVLLLASMSAFLLHLMSVVS